jgi:predicted nucleotidyltransferase
MTAVVDHPTPYPEVNALLQQLLSSVQAVLAHGLVGMYLDGSVATGDFEPDKSDIDFVVVDEVFLALKHMHARLATGASRWVTELEGSYVPRRALRRRDPRPARHPYLDRGSGTLAMVQQETGYLASRDADFVTGVTIHVTGGV